MSNSETEEEVSSEQSSSLVWEKPDKKVRRSSRVRRGTRRRFGKKKRAKPATKGSKSMESKKRTKRSVEKKQKSRRGRSFTGFPNSKVNSPRKAKVNARKMIFKTTTNLKAKLDSDRDLIKQEKEEMEFRERLKKEKEFFKRLVGKNKKKGKAVKTRRTKRESTKRKPGRKSALSTSRVKGSPDSEKSKRKKARNKLVTTEKKQGGKKVSLKQGKPRKISQVSTTVSTKISKIDDKASGNNKQVVKRRRKNSSPEWSEVDPSPSTSLYTTDTEEWHKKPSTSTRRKRGKNKIVVVKKNPPSCIPMQPSSETEFNRGVGGSGRTNKKRKLAPNTSKKKRSPGKRVKWDGLLNSSDYDEPSSSKMQDCELNNRTHDRYCPEAFEEYDFGRGEDKKRRKKANADVSPMKIDLNVDWNSIGGLQGHIQKLKEMVVLPMLYPSEFESFQMNPPKGVLFHGPPGTGKTLVARVLAAQCSQSGRKKVTFYMRKGADCLSKWVGEAERQLRLLFDEAHRNQPSIIFFDEIDGLAPIRSSRQDQIHSSIVSTLLALMDGLDGRGQIIVIGATNRIDAIDPALRRPGRFDRELCFSLPSRTARRHILQIKTKSWDPPLSDSNLDRLAELSVGYCGADLEALCREAFMNGVRRVFPQIYNSDVKLKIDPEKLSVTDEDFNNAMMDIVPTAQRSNVVYARSLPKVLEPLLKNQLDKVIKIQRSMFPLSCATISQRMNLEDQADGSKTEEVYEKIHIEPHRPKLLISAGQVGDGQSHIGVALLHSLEEFPLYSLDLASLYGDTNSRSPEEVVLRIFKEARKNAPSIVYWPNIERWWNAAMSQLQLVIYALVRDLPEDSPVFLIATSNNPAEDLCEPIREIFNESVGHYHMQKPNVQALETFWLSLLPLCKAEPRKKIKVKHDWPVLDVASDQENEENQSQNMARKELDIQIKLDFNRIRTFIRTCCNRLIKHFAGFYEDVDEPNVVTNNMSLVDVRERNNNRVHPSLELFLSDIDQIVANVQNSYNPDILEARDYMNDAFHLQDEALTLASQADTELVKRLSKIIERIKAEGKVLSAFKDSVGCKNHVPNSNKKKPIEMKATTNTPKVSITDKPKPLESGNAICEARKSGSPKISALPTKNEINKASTPVTKAPSHIPTTRSMGQECFKVLKERSERRATPTKIPALNLTKKEEQIRCTKPEKLNVSSHTVEINEERLIQLLKDAARIAKQQSLTISELESTYFRILNHIYYFSSSWNRKGLLEKISQEVKKLESL